MRGKIMCQFAGEFHHHTSEGSKSDGFGLVEDSVKYAKELGFTSLAITDHGMMSGCPKHYFSCIEHGIKPILGVEAYFQITFDDSKKYYHITLLAKNNTGYSNLCRMLSEAAESQVHYQKSKVAAFRGWIPIVTLEQFSKYNDGVILLSGCVGGEISQLILHEKRDVAEKLLQNFIDIFGDDFFIEVMPHPVIERETGKNIQKITNEQLIAWSKKYRLPVVMTNDAHYIKKEDYSTYQKMWELAKSEMYTDYSQLYLHTGEEQAIAWKQMMGTCGEEYLENTLMIEERCH